MIKGIPFNQMNDYEFEQFKKEFDLTKWNEYKTNMECCIEILKMKNVVPKPTEKIEHKSKFRKIYDILKE